MLATLHSSKGLEYPHVLLLGYNLLGHADPDGLSQDRNLLYIGITRAQRVLTFVVPEATAHVQSPLLPVDALHYIEHFWQDEP